MLVESDCATGSGFSWKWKKVETLQFSTEGGFPKRSCERSSEENSRGWGWSSRLQKDRAWTAVRILAFVLKRMGMTTERVVHGEATGSNLFQQDHSGCQAKNWLADSEESLPVVVKVQVEVQAHPRDKGLCWQSAWRCRSTQTGALETSCASLSVHLPSRVEPCYLHGAQTASGNCLSWKWQPYLAQYLLLRQPAPSN